MHTQSATTTTETTNPPPIPALAPWITLSERAAFLVDNLDLAEATQVEDARWEAFQLLHLCDNGAFRIENKSRQIAWSWLAAAEGVADAILDGRDAIYVSINLEEAKEKIRYARRIFETLAQNMAGLPSLRRDNELGLEFSNGVRLSSLPGRPPRGRARSNVYLDEFAHVQRDRQIYTAALPIISKGGRLRIGSSPLGASGTFWEVYAQRLRTYPGYTRQATPWWTIYAFSTDVAMARRTAPGLTTAERVARFGNERIQALHANMVAEDFAQEYECAIVDESTAWIAWEEIRAAQDEDLLCIMARASAGNLREAMAAIDDLAQRAQRGQQVEEVLAAGFDVGRTRNTSELYVVGISPAGSYPLRMAISLEAMAFDEQEQILSHALDRLPLAGLNIDQNGIGRNLAERLGNLYPGKARGVDFTNATKLRWATDAKMLIQQHKTPIPVDRELAYQMHSIKRLVTPARNLVFDTDTNEKHHADRFWAWALALAAAQEQIGVSDTDLARAFGYAV